MDAVECISGRRSIRGFTKNPVPKELLEQVLETASWSPSYKNSQPWEVMVVSGNTKEKLSKMMVELLESGAPSCPDLPDPRSWPEAEQAHINHLYASRKKATGIDLNAPEIIVKAKKANFHFYRAPHAIYLYQDATLSQWSLLDIGLFAQSLMLAAHAHGLATVPQAFVTDYAQNIKEFLAIPKSKRLVLGLSLGYPDLESPANAFRTDRMPTKEFVTFVD